MPFAAKKTERESGWLLEQVCKVPALAKLTRREQGVVIDAFRRKVFQGGQRLYVQGKGTDYLYLIEDGHVAVDADGGFTGQRNLPAADGTRHAGDQGRHEGGARAHGDGGDGQALGPGPRQVDAERDPEGLAAQEAPCSTPLR